MASKKKAVKKTRVVVPTEYRVVILGSKVNRAAELQRLFTDGFRPMLDSRGDELSFYSNLGSYVVFSK